MSEKEKPKYDPDEHQGGVEYFGPVPGHSGRSDVADDQSKRPMDTGQADPLQTP